MGRATRTAIRSGFASATRFGTISPMTMVRYVITTITTAYPIVDAYGARLGTRDRYPARAVAKAAPPKAPEMTPMSVIPIWTVERNRLGSSASSSAAFAPASPPSARVWSRWRRAETTANSDMEKRPLARMRRPITTASKSPAVATPPRAAPSQWE